MVGRLAVASLVLVSLPQGARADLYLNYPRGSNNKLNEVANTRANANRLFDSQNNANAGYQVGDNCTADAPCSDANNNYDASAAGAGAGVMSFYAGSRLYSEWTVQHGCGADNPNVDCEVVMQYTCEPELQLGAGELGGASLEGALRDGRTTATIPHANASRADPQYGRHESYAYYGACAARERNKGLFVADRNLGGQRHFAVHTRQNEAGTRRGYECPEERDYYPYWHPTPWRDVLVRTGTLGRCAYYRRESQNVARKGRCAKARQFNQRAKCELGAFLAALADAGELRFEDVWDFADRMHGRGGVDVWSEATALLSRDKLRSWGIANETAIAALVGRWTSRTDRVAAATGAWEEAAPWGLAAPECEAAQYSRTNHHGNSVGGRSVSYNWTVPWEAAWGDEGAASAAPQRCVLRVRYNISQPADFDAWSINASRNGAASPVKNNPRKDFTGLAAPVAYTTDNTLTWSAAAAFCYGKGQDLCTQQELCSSAGGAGGGSAAAAGEAVAAAAAAAHFTFTYDVTGRRRRTAAGKLAMPAGADGAHWAPVNNSVNEWVQVAAGRADTCKTYKEQHGGLGPVFGTSAAAYAARGVVACCSRHWREVVDVGGGQAGAAGAAGAAAACNASSAARGACPAHVGPLRLNVNTAQFPRTFEDRTHVFRILPRPRPLLAELAADASWWRRTPTIHNLGVRGRRGNIQQVYPAVEYDWAPTELHVREGDYVHFQWTGSDANRAGNAGNGRAMTDRSNLVQVQRRLLATD